MTRVAVIAIALALGLAVATPAAAHEIPPEDACSPPKDPLQGAPVMSDNVDYIGWQPGEAGDMTAGGRLVGRYFYMSGASHFSIYDTLNPESPELVSRVDFGCRFENEDITVDGRSLVYSDFTITRELYVYDVRDPANPKLVATLPDAGRHTMQCVLDCRLLYGSYQAATADGPLVSGEVVDLSDPTKPTVLGDWTAGDVLPSRKVHDVNEVSPGIIVSASAPIQVMDVRGDPLKPKVLGRSPDATKRYHSVEWPRGGHDRWMLSMFETNGTPRCEAGVGDFTVFDATGVGTSGEIKPVSSYFLQNANDELSQGNPEVNAGLGCSPHWFQVRPSWHDGGVVAMGAYDHGVKFLRVDGKGAITEAGHFRAAGTNASAAYWITCDVVYVVDYTRGLDVLKFKDAASACPQQGAPPTANVPPSAASCRGRVKPAVTIGRSSRRRVAGRARSARCGGRIARVDVAVARRGGRPRFVRARGTTRWSLHLRRALPRGTRVWVRATDAFGNVTVIRARMR